MLPRPQPFAIVLVCAVAMTAVAVDDKQPTYKTPQEAAADPDFAIQGEYAGDNIGYQVVASGGGEFRTVTYRGGLPGAGWNEKEKQEAEENTADVKNSIESLKLKKVERKSTTLGAKPPAGAVVLFDGTQTTLEKQWKPGARIGDDGLLMQGCSSRETFGDCTLHIEFRLPYMPKARGQARGNSGIYFGRYEVQMLDSFGLEGKDNECGGLYGFKPPDLNLCLPPLAWQTYDVDYTAAHWDKEGKKTAPRITVRHNGVVVHQDFDLPHTETATPKGEFTDVGAINLQDHGNPVHYSNIWIVPRNARIEARRPIVAGFERFPASPGADAAAGGRLLLGELNCVACHKAADRGEKAADRGDTPRLFGAIAPRQAPILDDVGKRTHPEYVVKFLADPHGMKPGTTMPDVLASLPLAERAAAALALTNFLVTTGALAEQAGDAKGAQRGKQLFQQVGCVACHQPREGKQVSSRTSAPLVDLEKKYSIPGLAAFLQDPQKVRPSGRMPGFNLEGKDFLDLANFLVGEVELRPRHPNMTFAVYHGNWEKVPNFDDLKPVKTGQCAGLDLNVAGRSGDFGMRFKGFLKIEREGDYTFHLGSDDGSLLFIDDKKVADADGIHPHQEHSGKARLTAGMHPLHVDYMQGGGEWTVTLEFEGPGVPRQEASRAIVMTEQGNPQPDPAPPATAAEPRFTFDVALADQGRVLFASHGCANCHQLKEKGASIAPRVFKPLDELDPSKGCLATSSDVATAYSPPYPRGGRGGSVVAVALETSCTGKIDFAIDKRDGAGLEATLDVDRLDRPPPAPPRIRGGDVISEFAAVAAAAAPAVDAGARPPVPQFDLNLNQRVALAAALTAGAPPVAPSPEETIAQTMTAFNCYACHARSKVGGPERDRNPLFTTTIPEMGDEGRVPPPLDGVGDKLNDEWLKHVLQNGSNDRPYMHARMPKFGMANVGHLVAAFAAVDRRTGAAIPQLAEPEIRAKAVGRHLVGDKALACIKCHTFGPHRATGIQALNLHTMTRRLREDWFFRYMVNPEAYRPGTRMPTGFGNGQATIRDVYEGDAGRQLLAIWTFLKDADKAAIPDGLIANVIELTPAGQPIVYRNFIDGLSPRGIAVGYPEKGHLAWDANKLSLTLLWHGRFIDAGRHWQGRGEGRQGPLGDHVVRLEETVPLAVLDSTAAEWPSSPPKDRGYKFTGYTLDAQGRPHFRYETPAFAVEDFPQPVARGNEGTFSRRLTITARGPVENLYFRAASGQTIEPQPDGWHFVNGTLRIRVPAAAGQPVLRTSAGKQELLIPVKLADGKFEIVQEIVW